MRTTRDRLIEIAGELVDEGGAAAVTMRAVGGLAGMSHNVAYKHFADKRDLLGCVAAAELHRLASQMSEAAALHDEGAAKLEASTLAYLDWARARPARFKLVFGPWGPEPHDELGEAASTATQAMYAGAAAAVADGTLQGDPARISALVWALAHGGADLDLGGHLRQKPGMPGPEELVRDLLAGIRAR